jgi:Ca2+-binding EF-hand superfamily protein
MREFLIGAAVIILAGAGAALAQAPVTTPAPQVAPVPPMADRIMTRDEVVGKIREHFAQLDGNRDGFLTKEEAAAGRKVIKERFRERRAERGAQRMEGRDPKIAFDRLDTNKDGAISRDEFAKGREARIERRIVMHDGQPGGHAGGAHQGMRMHRMGGMMLRGHMFEMADANKDGRVSLQEATESAVRHFDMADANRDGRVTPEERRQMHRQMMEKHRAPKAG